jgi:competence protein ComEC
MKKVILWALVLLLGFLAYVSVHLIIFSDKKLHIVFCDVGQGDAILIRSSSGIVSLVDGGPDDSVEECLSRHLPFWQKTITLMIVSHPHTDHFAGMIGVLDHYSVLHFATEKLNNDAAIFHALLEKLHEKGLSETYLYAGDAYHFQDGLTIKILGPTKAYLQETSPNGQIGEREEFASIVSLIHYKDFSLILDGDSQASGLEEAESRLSLPSISVLQVPHHGSKTGLNEAVLKRLHPRLAVISVGKNNYGHPTPFTLDLLRKQGVEVRETMTSGDIELVSDGEGFILR